MGSATHPPMSPTHQSPNPQIPVQHSPLPPGMAAPAGGAPSYTSEPTMMRGSYPPATAPVPSISPMPSYGSPPPTGGEPPSDGSGDKPKKPKKKLLIGVGAVIVVLVLAGVGFLVLGGGSDGEGTESVKASDTTSAAAGATKKASDTTEAKASTTVATTSTIPESLPDVTGMTIADATNKLESIGITVKTLTTLDESKTDGTVVKQDPAAGETYTDTVTLTVAQQPIITYLSDLKSVADSGCCDSWLTGSVKIDATDYLNSVSVGLYPSSDTFIEYDLSKSFTQFRTTVGMTDDAASDASVTYEVLGDGRKLASGTVALGKPAPLNVDVTGVLRLRLHFVAKGWEGNSSRAAWGTAALYSAEPPPESLTATDDN